MIAADTSSLVSFFRGEDGEDIQKLAEAMKAGQLAISPVVITEMLSATDSTALSNVLAQIEILEPGPNYWHNAGSNRHLLRQKGCKAKVADALIAQSCIDHGVALITRDRDFRHFEKHCGLKLA